MSRYVDELRDLVGHRPLVLVGSAALIFDDQRRVLLQRRGDTGGWGLPGGLMEIGESLEDTARREIREETGLVMASFHLVRIFSGPDFYYRYPNGDEVYNVTALYLADAFEGHLGADGVEGLELRHFPLDDIPADTIRPDQLMLAAFRASVEG